MDNRNIWACAAFLVLSILAVLFACPAHAWDAHVDRVLDGDTVDVIRTDSGDKVRIRLYGVDAPEFGKNGHTDQPGAQVAYTHLSAWLPGGSEIEVLEHSRDYYGRVVATILIDDLVVQEALLEQGLAWVDGRYCRGCEEWQLIQDYAADHHRGIWEHEATPPWEWRKAHR